MLRKVLRGIVKSFPIAGCNPPERCVYWLVNQNPVRKTSLEDRIGVTRNRRQKKDKQGSIQHFTENYKLSNSMKNKHEFDELF